VAAHEISHAAMRAGDKGLILKLDYEKPMIGSAGTSCRTC
jgi:hypothetical protein